jgi:hypothetical protein
MPIHLLVAALAFQAVPDEAAAEAALKRLKTDSSGVALEKRAEAFIAALQVPHEKVIKTVGDALVTEPDAVRIPLARALAEVDHPAAVKALADAVGPNVRRLEVARELLKSLGELGWQSACAPLHELVRQVASADVREVLPDVLDVLGRLGNPASIDVIADLLEKLEGPRRAPWPNEKLLLRHGEEALQRITGKKLNRVEEWKAWWRQSQEIMKGRATRTFWSTRTHERSDLAPGEKTPPDAVLVAVRIAPETPGTGAAKARKKNKS